MLDDETRALLTTARDWALQYQGEKGWNVNRDDFIKRIEATLDADGVREVRAALIEAVKDSWDAPGQPAFGDVSSSHGKMTMRQAMERLAPFVAKRLQPRERR